MPMSSIILATALVIAFRKNLRLWYGGLGHGKGMEKRGDKCRSKRFSVVFCSFFWFKVVRVDMKNKALYLR